MIWTVEHEHSAADVRRSWTVAETPVTDPVVTDLLRRYFLDIASSFYGRPATAAEADAAMVAEPSDDLVRPGGVLLVGRCGGEPGGCVGLRFGPPGFAELTRMFVLPDLRRRGGASVLLAAAEGAARAWGAHTVRLDTRLDLTEARALYSRHGYREIPAYSEGPYAQVWYGKTLG
jgi:GNAT superfamily N-acetyltransferase